MKGKTLVSFRMSFANYTENIDGQVQFAPDDIFLKQEPTSLDEGARVADTITYFGNATYPLSPPTVDTVGITDIAFKTLFVSGLNQDDIMRIRPSEETKNFKQYSNVVFNFGVEHSCPTLDLRVAILDAGLNVIQTYDTVSLDLSGLEINQATLRGFSVDYPTDGVYATIQGSNPSGSGTASLTFQYFNSQLENAIDTSIEPGDTPSRSPTDLFVVETYDTIYDLSGSGAIISQLQSDVATNQADIVTLNAEVGGLSGEVDTAVVDIASLQSGKVDKSGDTMTGSLTISNPTAYPTGWRSEIKIGSGLAGVIEANDLCENFCPAIGFYGSEAETQRSIYFWSGVDSGNQRNPGPAWLDYTVLLGDTLQVRTNLEMAGGNALPGNIIMNTQNVKGMGEPVDPSDATTKSYVDTAVIGKLSRVGGTMAGALSMGGYRINNLQTPATATDGATKGYVDQAVESGGGTITGFDAPLTINNPASRLTGLIVSGGTQPGLLLNPSSGSEFNLYSSGAGVNLYDQTAGKNIINADSTGITLGNLGSNAATDAYPLKAGYQPGGRQLFNEIAVPAPQTNGSMWITKSFGRIGSAPSTVPPYIEWWTGSPPRNAVVEIVTDNDVSGHSALDIVCKASDNSVGVHSIFDIDIILNNQTVAGSSGQPVMTQPQTFTIRAWDSESFTNPSPVIKNTLTLDGRVSTLSYTILPGDIVTLHLAIRCIRQGSLYNNYILVR